jgi:hypothetical protein
MTGSAMVGTVPGVARVALFRPADCELPGG